MLRRPLNNNEYEYEIQGSKNKVEQKFYEYFIDYIKRINFDMSEYQIIVNPMEFKIEIRIRMKKLNMCFASEFDLDVLEHCYFEGRGSVVDVCERVIQPIKEYAMSLCYRDKVKN